MIKSLPKIVSIGCIALYLLVKILKHLDYPMGFFMKNHLTDLLCMPLILYLIFWIVRFIPAYKKLEKLPIVGIVGVTIYWAFYFEYYLPTKSLQYTGDGLDVLMYFLGSLLFILLQYVSGWDAG